MTAIRILTITFLLCTPLSLVADQEVRDGVFIHLSQGPDDPQRVLMALNMALIMVEDHDVLVYFDIDAVQLVVTGASELEYDPFPTAHTLLAELREKGVTLMACPGCLQAAGKSGDDLMPGITLADKATFFDFTEGRILSLDY